MVQKCEYVIAKSTGKARKIKSVHNKSGFGMHREYVSTGGLVPKGTHAYTEKKAKKVIQSRKTK